MLHVASTGRVVDMGTEKIAQLGCVQVNETAQDIERGFRVISLVSFTLPSLFPDDMSLAAPLIPVKWSSIIASDS